MFSFDLNTAIAQFLLHSCLPRLFSEALAGTCCDPSPGLVPSAYFSPVMTHHDWFPGGVRSPDGTCAAFLPSGCVEFCRGQCRYRSVPTVSSVSHLLRMFCLQHSHKNHNNLSRGFSGLRVHDVFWPSLCVALDYVSSSFRVTLSPCH